MTGYTAHRKVEILVDAPLAAKVIDIINGCGGTGYTVFQAIAGAGQHGTWSDDQITGAGNKVLVLTVASQAVADRIALQLSGLLDSHTLLMWICDAAVIRPHKF